MSTGQMRFAKRISDALIDCLNGFADTRRKSIVQGFLPITAKNLAPEQFKNAVKVLQLLRFLIVQQALYKLFEIVLAFFKKRVHCLEYEQKQLFKRDTDCYYNGRPCK